MPVIVLGMHRSGTSALTRLLHLFGLSLGREDDLLRPDSSNARGYWESRTLNVVNEEILNALGGCWCLPPRLEGAWWNSEPAMRLKNHARAAFDSIYGTAREWAWKDPRNCLTLPFWMDVLASRPVIVFMYRN